jgi:predicted nuclease of predicted toxin-antitoxin system
VSTLIKVDEDLPRGIDDLFDSRGHNAATVVGQGWSGVSDETLWSRVQSEGRWLITADKGFADLRKYPPGSHAGVILLRPREESRRAYLELAARAVVRLDLDNERGAIIVVTPAAFACAAGFRRAEYAIANP